MVDDLGPTKEKWRAGQRVKRELRLNERLRGKRERETASNYTVITKRKQIDEG